MITEVRSSGTGEGPIPSNFTLMKKFKMSPTQFLCHSLTAV